MVSSLDHSIVVELPDVGVAESHIGAAEVVGLRQKLFKKFRGRKYEVTSLRLFFTLTLVTKQTQENYEKKLKLSQKN